MSRLADILARLDVRGARPSGVGGIASLGGAAPAERRRMWRPGVLLVILGVMAAIAVALMLRPQGPAPAPIPPPVARLPAAPPPSVTARATTAEERYRILMGEGVQAARRGAFADAAALFREAAEIDANDPEAWNNLGVALVRQGDRAKGMEAFRRALRARPEHAEAHRNLGVALDLQGQGLQAAEQYRAFLRHAAAEHRDREDIQRRLRQMGARPGEQ